VTPRNAWFFPAGKHLLVFGKESGHGRRFYVKDLASGPPRPITLEGIRVPAFRPISPDGKQLLARGPERSLKVFPVAGGEAKVLPGAAPGDWPVQWTSDGRGVYVLYSVSRIEVETGRRTLWNRPRRAFDLTLDPVRDAAACELLASDELLAP
jgi:hypothetical protein